MLKLNHLCRLQEKSCVGCEPQLIGRSLGRKLSETPCLAMHQDSGNDMTQHYESYDKYEETLFFLLGFSESADLYQKHLMK